MTELEPNRRTDFFSASEDRAPAQGWSAAPPPCRRSPGRGVPAPQATVLRSLPLLASTEPTSLRPRISENRTIVRKPDVAGRAEAVLSSGSPGTAVAPFVRVLRSESAKPAAYRRREPEKTLLIERSASASRPSCATSRKPTCVCPGRSPRSSRPISRVANSRRDSSAASAGTVEGTACPSCGAKRMAAEAAHPT